ncbi:MAG: efflux RND transporter periplasmic adaptor subunit [Steroidobacteraceae bacterium]
MNAISRPRRYGVWILVALAVAGGVYYWSTQAKKTEVITMDKIAVMRGNLIESIASTGSLSAYEEVTVGSQVSGIVTKVLVDFNDYVKKGDLLAVVDPQTLQAQVDSSRATLAQRQINYDEAVRQLEEGKPLQEKGYLSDKDLRTLEVAVRNAKAQLDSAAIDFNKQNVQLDYAQIRAPIDGIIMSRTVDPGNTVQSSLQAPTLFVVASDLTKMKILASVDETQIAEIKDGMKAHFTVTGIADKTFNAIVKQVRLQPTTTNNVVTYTVVLDAENPDKVLFPGMTATIDFIKTSLDDVLLIPSAALRVIVPTEMRVADATGNAGPSAGFTGGGLGQRGQGMGAGGRNAVWLVNAEGKAYRVPVRVLGSDLTNMAVQSAQPDALKEGDEVITRVVNPGSSSSSSSRNVLQGVGGGMRPR